MKYTPEELQSLIDMVNAVETTRLSQDTFPKPRTFLEMLTHILTTARDKKQDISETCILEKAVSSVNHMMMYQQIIRELRELLYDLPIEELPLHLNKGGSLYHDIISWRLEIGK